MGTALFLVNCMNVSTPQSKPSLFKRLTQLLTYWRISLQVRWSLFCLDREVYHIRHMAPRAALERIQEWKDMLSKQKDSEHVRSLRLLVESLEKYSLVRAEREEKWLNNLPWEEITALVLTIGVVALLAAGYYWFHHLPR